MMCLVLAGVRRSWRSMCGGSRGKSGSPKVGKSGSEYKSGVSSRESGVGIHSPTVGKLGSRVVGKEEYKTANPEGVESSYPRVQPGGDCPEDCEDKKRSSEKELNFFLSSFTIL